MTDYKINPRTGKFDMVGTASDTPGNGSEYVLPPATKNTLGGVIVGTGLSVAGNGRIDIDGNTIMKLLDVSELADFWLQNLNWEYPNAENLNLYLKGTTDGIYRFQVLDSMCVQDYPVFKNVCIYTLTGDGVEHPYIAQDALSPDDTVIFDSMLLRTTNLYISCNAVINRNNRSGANYRNFLNTTLHVDGNLTVDSGRWHFNTVNVGGTLTLETYAENLGRGNIIKCRELSIRSSYYSQQILDNNLFIVGNRMIDTGHQSSS